MSVGLCAPEVVALSIHPLKSGAGRAVDAAQVALEGLAGDRRLMIVRSDGTALTARDHPAILAIACQLEDSVPGRWSLALQAPGMMPLSVDLAASPDATRVVTVWGDRVVAGAGIARADEWVSRYLRAECHFVWMCAKTSRPIAGWPDKHVTFADAAPLLLASSSSLADLNDRMAHPVDMRRFRPNVVVGGSPAFDEDSWKRIRIGDVEFDVAGACDRCVVVTLNPDAPGELHSGEPLATLATYRRAASGKVYFGQLLVPRSPGRLTVGQAVEVLDRGTAPIFSLPLPSRLRLLEPAALAPHLPDTSAGPSPLVMRCSGVTQETHDIRTFHLVHQDGAPVTYKPGQFLTLRGQIQGESWSRCYSLSSTPSRPSDVAITVKRTAGGRVSNWLHENLRPGDLIEAVGPAGRFHYPGRPASKVLLLSGGSGITPVMSMLRWLLDTALPVSIVFHHSARTCQDVAFAPELASLAKVQGLRLSFNFSRGDQPFGHGLPNTCDGHLDAAMLDDVCPDVDERAVFSCGPEAWMSRVREALSSRPGFRMDQLLEERFVSPTAPMERPRQPYSVRFVRTGQSLAGEHQTTLLALAAQAGVSLPTGCESGLCGTCRCRVLSGHWTLSPSCADPERSILSDDDKATGVVLACTTCPVQDVEVDL